MSDAAGPSERDGANRREPASTINVANMLTVFRLALVPLFLFILFTADEGEHGWRILATALFGLAAVTDQVDGWVARKRGLITNFGKIVDPIADKALIGAALVGLSALGELAWWVTVLIIVREVGVTVLRFVVIRHGVLPASRGGKAKTAAQITAIVLYLLPLPGVLVPVSWVAMGVAVVLTVVTGVDYVFRAVRMRAEARHRGGDAAAGGADQR